MDAVEQKDFQADRPAYTQTPSKSPKKIPVWIIIVIAILFLSLIGFLIFKPRSTPQPQPIPEPVTVKTDFPSPTPEPSPEIDRSEITIQVLNGTGIAGEAKFLQDELSDLDYSQIDVGNASKQDHQAVQASFATDVPDLIKDEIVEKLEDLYQDVEQDSLSDAEDIDIQIITGLRIGATPKPKASPESDSESSPSGST